MTLIYEVKREIWSIDKQIDMILNTRRIIIFQNYDL